MFFRPLAALLAVSLYSMAADLPPAPGKENPNPSLVVNNSADAYRVRISNNFGDVVFGTVLCYDGKDTELKTELKKLKNKEDFIDLPAKSSLQLVVTGSENLKKVYVSMYLSLDKGNDKSVARLRFTHAQYNKDILKPEELLERFKALSIPIPSVVSDKLSSLPKDPVIIDKKTKKIETTLDNYQRADEGPLWEIKAN